MLDTGIIFDYSLFMDHLSKEKRSENMAKIKSSNTKPELRVRSLLHKLGFRFRLNRNDLPGKPDLVLPKYRIALFVHGCFWHSHEGCRKSHLPGSNLDYWEKKLSRNKERDANNQSRLESLGWKVVVVWECETKREHDLVEILQQRLQPTVNQNK